MQHLCVYFSVNQQCQVLYTLLIKFVTYLITHWQLENLNKGSRIGRNS